MTFRAFMPMGTTKLIAASSSTAGAEITQVCTGSQQGMFLANPSTVPVYVATGQTSAVQAACPTTAVPATGLCVINGQALPISTPPGGWLSAVTSAGSANLFVTPGLLG